MTEYDNSTTGRYGNWMQTYSGRQFWPMDPRPEEIFIEDVAHALSQMCRYAGHCERFYSVAEHLVLCSQHDATEAYVVDVPRPLKPYLRDYGDIEEGVWITVAKRFGLPFELLASVKLADNAVLLAESVQIMKPHPAPWSVPGEAADVVVTGWLPPLAEKRFLARFHELTEGAYL